MFTKNTSIINLNYFSFLILTISICYSLFGNYPNNWGDPKVYLDIASNFDDLSLTRFLGYPLYLKIFSLNLRLIYLPAIFQVIIFVISIILLEREINKKNDKSYFIYLLMSLPGITYTHILMFPDSLVLSMLCLYVFFLLRNNFLSLFLISLILFLLKSYLIFIILFTLLFFFEKKFLLIKKIKIKYFFTFIFPILFYIFLPNHLVQPFFSKTEINNLYFNYQVNCNSKIINISENDIYINKSHIQFGSILRKKTDFDENCYSSIEKKISRLIINNIFKNNFDDVFDKTVLNFISSFSGIGTNNHITSMIGVDFFNKTELLKNDQISGLDYKIFNKIQDKSISNKVLNINSLIDKFNLLHIVIFTKLQFLISIMMLLTIFFLLFKKKNNFYVSNLFALNINFAIMHAFFALAVDDRYVFFVLLFQIITILLLTNKTSKSISSYGNYKF